LSNICAEIFGQYLGIVVERTKCIKALGWDSNIEMMRVNMSAVAREFDRGQGLKLSLELGRVTVSYDTEDLVTMVSLPAEAVNLDADSQLRNE
jgi:hypothetical protein